MDSESDGRQDDALESSNVLGHLRQDDGDEDYYKRPRAKSEATTDMSKGRLNAAWASFKRSWGCEARERGGRYFATFTGLQDSAS
jgi:hypothetical protein